MHGQSFRLRTCAWLFTGSSSHKTCFCCHQECPASSSSEYASMCFAIKLAMQHACMHACNHSQDESTVRRRPLTSMPAGPSRALGLPYINGSPADVQSFKYELQAGTTAGNLS